MGNTVPIVHHQFKRGPLKAQQLKEHLGDGITAIFKPFGKEVEGTVYQHSVQVDSIESPDRYLVSVAGRLMWVEVRPVLAD